VRGVGNHKGQFSILLRSTRRAAGLTQFELGRQLLHPHNRLMSYEVVRLQIRGYEAGKRLPTEERAVALANLLDKNPQVFLDALRQQRKEVKRRRRLEAEHG
jgi:transcriptional regulator with XRE-family HTH domain